MVGDIAATVCGFAVAYMHATSVLWAIAMSAHLLALIAAVSLGYFVYAMLRDWKLLGAYTILRLAIVACGIGKHSLTFYAGLVVSISDLAIVVSAYLVPHLVPEYISSSANVELPNMKK
ncbi:unnamed protein product [Cuscuta epithymum]|uniref:Uncharacterized protein n=1 Tax=Cuscuta epithymum TaxID=186058 RepID=A0AAV0G853_9ASTE|nr:unnamed protein product [Cuscuta epithymum]